MQVMMISVSHTLVNWARNNHLPQQRQCDRWDLFAVKLVSYYSHMSHDVISGQMRKMWNYLRRSVLLYQPHEILKECSVEEFKPGHLCFYRLNIYPIFEKTFECPSRCSQGTCLLQKDKARQIFSSTTFLHKNEQKYKL